MKNKSDLNSQDLKFEQKLEYEKLKIERLKLKIELMKWGLIAVGAIVTFWVIDMGKLEIEKFNAKSSNQEKLLDSYLLATESPNPDLWKRKLSLIGHFSNDSTIIKWAEKERKYIDEKAALLALYKETVNITSILANRQIYGSTDWMSASKRYYQLYWAELPFYGESQPVISAMIHFKRKLDSIQNNEATDKWAKMDNALIKLAKTLKDESKKLEQK